MVPSESASASAIMAPVFGKDFLLLRFIQQRYVFIYHGWTVPWVPHRTHSIVLLVSTTYIYAVTHKLTSVTVLHRHRVSAQGRPAAGSSAVGDASRPGVSHVFHTSGHRVPGPGHDSLRYVHLTKLNLKLSSARLSGRLCRVSELTVIGILSDILFSLLIHEHE